MLVKPTCGFSGLSFGRYLLAFMAACGARSDLTDGRLPTDAGSTVDASLDANDASLFPAGFDLTVTPSQVTLVQGGGPASITVHVARMGGFTGEVDVAIGSLPPGVSATSVAIAPYVTDATLALTAATSGPQAAQAAVVLGTAVAVPSVSKPLSLFVRGRPGSLDTTFNATGLAVLDGMYGRSIAVDANGAILVPGSTWPGSTKAVVTRVRANGSLDPAFGTAGSVTFAPAQQVSLRELSIANDGNIVVCGSSGLQTNAVLLAELDGTGALVPKFAGAGMLTLVGGSCYGVQFNADDTMLMANDVGGPNIVRVLADGSLDASYGTLPLPWPYGDLGDANITFDSSGRALVGGGGRGDGLMARISSGAIDKTFGGGGTVADPVLLTFYWIDSNATSLLGVGGGYSGAVVAKYRAADGTLDPSFGNGGRVTYQWAEGETFASVGLFQADGKVFVLGAYIESFGHSQLTFTYVRRFTASGAADPTFAGGDIYRFDDGDPATLGNAPGGMALYPDDRVVVRFNAERWGGREAWATVLARLWL